jgi:hypothetical protein
MWSFLQNVDPKHCAQMCLNSQHVQLAALREPEHDLLCKHVKGLLEKETKGMVEVRAKFEKAFACPQCHVAKLAGIVF